MMHSILPSPGQLRFCGWAAAFGLLLSSLQAESFPPTGLSFEGSTHIEIDPPPESPILFVEMWVKLPEAGYDGDGTMITPLTDTTQTGHYLAVWTREGRVVAEIRDGSTEDRLFSESLINDGEWHHVGVLFRDTSAPAPLAENSDGIVIYINGEEDARTPHNDSFPTANRGAGIGRRERSNPSHYFEGTLSQIRVWDRALGESEIQENMYAERSGDEPGLVAYWKLDDTADNVAWDASPSENHGTIVRPVHDWSWAGFVTADSAVIKAGRPDTPPALQVATGSEFQDTLEIDPASIIDAGDLGQLAEYRVEGLQPDTLYHYRWADRQEEGPFGQFRTMPERAASFTLGFSACAGTGSNHEVFDVIRSHEPDFFVHTGDLHYEDIATNDVNRFYRAYHDVLLGSPRQNRLFRSMPVAYMWDDHDYGPNNSDSTAPGREAALASYRNVVPHYPAALGEAPDTPVGQAFSAGRVRFIMPDLRSHRTPNSAPDGPDKTMMGHDQRAWFKEEMLAARDDYALIVLVSGVPWISPDGGHSDSWASFQHERHLISQFMVENGIDNVVMIAGDAHMLGADDGSNNTYATVDGVTGPGFPVYHAAALDRGGSVKGGPYSHPTFPGGGHFGLLHIEDNGERIRATFEGRHYDEGVKLELQYETGTRSFGAWARSHFTAAERADEAIGGLYADPGGDSISNLVKYAFGLDPWTPVARGDLPTTEFPADNGRFRIHYRERSDARDIEYVTEISHDLETWTAADVTETLRESDGDRKGFDKVTVETTTLDTVERAFIRIKIRLRDDKVESDPPRL